MRSEARFKLGAALALLARGSPCALIFGSVGDAGSAVPANKVLQDPFADGLGLPRERRGAVDPGGQEPGRAPAHLAEQVDDRRHRQVGRVYDGGASDIGYEVSVNGGETWKNGELPLTIQGGQATTCGGPLSGPATPSPPTTRRHDVGSSSTLGLSNGGERARRVYINRGTAEFTTTDIDWGPPICQHITPAGESPDKNWITCDNWPNSKGYGNCYVEWDNNGNGNREIIQYSTDGGLTWFPPPTTNMNASALPGNGNTGDVSR